MKRPSLDKVSIYLLTAFVGYMIADITILSSREKMMPERAATLPRPSRRPPPVVDRNAYSGILAKNIFNSDGKIPPAMGAGEGPASPDAPPVPSQLPITLIGTIVHTNPARSVATINLRNKNEQRSFKVDDDIEGLAKITNIERSKVIIRNSNTQRLEFIEIKEESKINFGSTAPKTNGEVTELNEKEFALKRDDLNRLTSDLPALLQQARAIPNMGPDGVPNGFRIMDIAPGSIYERLGIKKNDVIKSVNGEKVDSPAKAMELYNALKSSSNIRIGVERNGRDEELGYSIQ